MKVYTKSYVPDVIETDIYNNILASEKTEKELHKRIKNTKKNVGFFLVKSEKDLTAIKKVANELNLDKVILLNESEVGSSEVLQKRLIQY